ncbi:hypothetical protein ACHAW6_012355 [Cyclotella cf. meneghiniana]
MTITILKFLTLLFSCVRGQMTRTCGLFRNQVENIYVEDVSGEIRRLRGKQTDYIGAFVKVEHLDLDNSFQRWIEVSGEINAENKNQSTSHHNLIPFKGLHCDCTSRLPTTESFYCPVSSTACQVWRSFRNDDYRVSCTNENWKVSYARYMWYYLIFWFAFLTLSLLLTVPGQHAIKFCFSRWFPSINTRITDLILEMETQRRRQAEESFAYHRHLQRRQDGWVSGYKLKTKRYCGDQYHSDDSKNDIPTNNGEAKKDETSEESERDESDIHPQDVCNVDSNAHICTICLLEIEKGDLIADVKCGHFYHANCLSEWILKKNSCPLCQTTDVAEEMRSFETEADFSSNSISGNHPNTPFGELRRWAHMSVVGNGYRLYGLGSHTSPLDSGDQRVFSIFTR